MHLGRRGPWVRVDSVEVAVEVKVRRPLFALPILFGVWFLSALIELFVYLFICLLIDGLVWFGLV